MKALIGVSIVVCTADRPDKLQTLLDSFTTLLVPSAVSAELILVNNRPDTDITPIVAKVAGRLPLLVKQVIEIVTINSHTLSVQSEKDYVF